MPLRDQVRGFKITSHVPVLRRVVTERYATARPPTSPVTPCSCPAPTSSFPSVSRPYPRSAKESWPASPAGGSGQSYADTTARLRESGRSTRRSRISASPCGRGRCAGAAPICSPRVVRSSPTSGVCFWCPRRRRCRCGSSPGSATSWPALSIHRSWPTLRISPGRRRRCPARSTSAIPALGAPSSAW